jgi:hypothetical protein
MNPQVLARTSPNPVPNITPVATAAVRVVAPVYASRVPYARALYAAAVAALLAACTPPERAPTPDVPARVAPFVATVDSAVVGDELPVVIVTGTREMPEVVVTASRERLGRIG